MLEPLIFSFLSFLVLCGPGEEELGLEYFLKRLYDLDGLAHLEEGLSSRQASSYDRLSRYDEKSGDYVDWDANNDHGRYLRVIKETREAVMADLVGPGVINRIWSANPQGTIRFYLDGAEAPLEFPFAELCSGTIDPFLEPLVWKRSAVLGGDNPASDCYLPIPFNKSCRVAADQAYDQYYHIGYTVYPKNCAIRTFSLPLTPSEEAALAEARTKLSHPGLDPKAGDYAFQKGSLEIVPGKESPLAAIKGPAAIQRFYLSIEPGDLETLRQVLLQVYWDDEVKPSILAPAGDFFGQSFKTDDFKSLPMGFREGEGYCFFRMPFERKARFTLLNLGRRPVRTKYRIEFADLEALPEKTAYFHAGWRREKYCDSFEYPVLDCRGRGRFVGMALFVDNAHGGWWGEGDEKIYVDGEKFPSFFGTGTEDYFGDAWGIREFENAFHGCSRAQETRNSCYRWHISDSIPFNNAFRFTIENYSAARNTKNDYASMAYWYQEPGPSGKSFFDRPTRIECLPRIPSFVKGSLEAENLYPQDKLPEGARIVFDEDLPFSLSGGAGLEIHGEAGSLFYLPVTVQRRDVYRIEVVTAPPSDVPDHTVTLDGKSLGPRTLLNPGKTILNLGFRGGETKPLIVDYVELEALRKYITRWAVTGPFDNPENVGLHVPYPPEEQPSLTGREVYEGKGGIALRWKIVHADEAGRVGLVREMEPDSWGVAYAYATVTSPEAVETDLYVGSDDGIKVWINGAVVHDHRVDRGFVPDEDNRVVALARGLNRVLVKVDQGAGDWAFSLRFRDDLDQLVYGLEGLSLPELRPVEDVR